MDPRRVPAAVGMAETPARSAGCANVTIQLGKTEYTQFIHFIESQYTSILTVLSLDGMMVAPTIFLVSGVCVLVTNPTASPNVKDQWLTSSQPVMELANEALLDSPRCF
uniref:Uncharacterized protein n=1 Tax=Haemonchus contortus TaxID=6289 RepID=W6NE65_HAECO